MANEVRALTPFEEAIKQDRGFPSRFNGNRFDRDMRWQAERVYAMQHAARNADLLRCTPESIRSAMLEVAWSGMTLAPSLGHAYLIPYFNEALRAKEVSFMPGYRGLAHMAMKGGAVTGYTVGRAMAHDHFRVYTKNNRRVVEHEENYKVADRGPLIAVYGILPLATGEEIVEVTSAATIKPAEQAASKRNAKGGMVWRGPFRDQMEIKVCLRRALKLVPSDPQGWLKHGLTVLDKHDAIDFEKADDQEAPGQQVLCVSEDQVQELHATLTDRGMPSARASNWLQNAAEAYNCRNIHDLPADKFDEVKTRLIARLEKVSSNG